MTDRELMQMALDALETYGWNKAGAAWDAEDAKKALRDRLAHPEPDAVLVEREACARIVEADADARGKGGGGLVLLKAASRIRARGEK
jgi:carbamate kinase